LYEAPVKLMSVVAVMLVVPDAPGAVFPSPAKETVLPEIVTSLKWVLFPMAPPRVTFPPPAWMVRFLPATSPLIVPVIAMGPPEEARTTVAAVVVTLPVSVIALALVVMPPPSVMAPVSSTAPVEISEPCVIVEPDAVKQPSGVVLPTGPTNVIAPVPATSVKQAGPSTVLEKVIFPLLLVSVEGSSTWTALA